jgi:hypothetical protein
MQLRSPNNPNFEGLPEFPKVIIGIPFAEEMEKPSQSYTQLTAKYQVSVDLVSFFNEDILGDNRFDIYGFLPPKYWMVGPDVIGKIVAKFMELPQIIGGVYTDIEIADKYNNEEYTFNYYGDYYHEGMSMINGPVFINRKLCPNAMFTESDNIFQTFLLGLTQQGIMLVHLAEPLFKKNV